MSDTTVNSYDPYIQVRDRYKNKKQFSTELDQNAFMKLFIEQLKHQDPTAPMDNSQFMQQTSMMAMVERLTRMQTLMEEANSSLLNIREYEGLIGKNATYTYEDGEGLFEERTGAISSVKMVDGKIYFTIGSDIVPRDKIEGVESKGMSNDSVLDNTLKYSQLIGYRATYLEPVTGSDGQTVNEERTAVISAVTMKNGIVQLLLDNEKKVNPNQIIGLEPVK